MKTAISIPNPIFEAAELLAKRLKMTRSKLFAKAVAAFVQKERNAQVTEKLNAIYRHESSFLEKDLQELQSMSIPHEKWR